jgi:hypothetical protein
MRLLNWWDVRVRGKTVIRGIIEYVPKGSGGFRPLFEVSPRVEDESSKLRTTEFIRKDKRL